MMKIPGNSGAESDLITGAAGASKCTGTIIISVTVSPRASVLEELGVSRRTASIRVSELPAAAKLGLPKSFASALTGDSLSTSLRHLQFRRASAIEIYDAAGSNTFTTVAVRSAGLWDDKHGKIVAVDEADVIKIQGAAAI